MKYFDTDDLVFDTTLLLPLDFRALDCGFVNTQLY